MRHFCKRQLQAWWGTCSSKEGSFQPASYNQTPLVYTVFPLLFSYCSSITMAASTSSNATCVFDDTFHRVTDPNYNWTRARDEYTDGWSDKTAQLRRLFSVRVGDSEVSIPGCFYLGTLNSTKAKERENGGGSAVLSTQTHEIADADVWFCALRNQVVKAADSAPKPPTDEDIRYMQNNISSRPALTCNMPSKNSALYGRSFLSWLPLLSVAITSLVALS